MPIIPAASPGKFLRWKSDGSLELENVTISQLFDSIAARSEAEATQSRWLDVSAVPDTTPSLPAVTGAGSVAAVSVLTPVSASTSLAAVSGTGEIAALTFTAGSGVTVGAAAVSGTGELATVTVSGSTGGGSLPASDDFTRATLADGAHPWLAPTGMTAPALSGNAVSFPAGAVRSAYWDAADFTNAQFAWAALPLDAVGAVAGPTVRQSASGDTCYWARRNDYDDEGTVYSVAFGKVVAGVWTLFGAIGNSSPYIGIDVSGTTVRLMVSSNGTTWTQAGTSATDSAIASGKAGMRADAGSGTTLDNFHAGNGTL